MHSRVAGIFLQGPRSRLIWIHGGPGEVAPVVTKGDVFPAKTRDGRNLPLFVHRVHGAKGWTVSFGGISILSVPRSSKKLAVLAALALATEYDFTRWHDLLDRNRRLIGLSPLAAARIGRSNLDDVLEK